MAKQKSLPVSLSDRERWLGFFYLAFQLCVLPRLLYSLNDLLARPMATVWLNFLYFSLNFLFIFAIFKDFFHRCLVQAGKHARSFLIAALAGFCAYWLINFLLGLAIARFLPEFVNLNDSTIADMGTEQFSVTVLGTVVLVPVVEETLHRGLVFGSLHRRQPTLAYLISTLLFAAIHIMGYVGIYAYDALAVAFVQYLPAGILLAWAYQKSGSIFAPMLIHMAINAVGICVVR